MKILSLLLFSLNVLFFGHSFAQSIQYSKLIKQADSLYKAKAYEASALTYSEAFKSLGWKGYSNDRYNAACAWALLGNADSAFYNLDKIVIKLGYSDVNHISTDPDLFSLHSDKRWLILIEFVKQNKDKAEENLNKPLMHLLDSLFTDDQKQLNLSRELNNIEPKDTVAIATLRAKKRVSNNLNYSILKKIFAEFGFPNFDLVGRTGSHNFWLLVQHQDDHPTFQDSVLTKMKIEVDQNKASKTNYAFLLDRVKVNTGQLQVYGTQMTVNESGTSYMPKPVIEPDKLNERRKSVGLDTIEEYIITMNTRYHGTLKKK